MEIEFIEEKENKVDIFLFFLNFIKNLLTISLTIDEMQVQVRQIMLQFFLLSKGWQVVS